VNITNIINVNQELNNIEEKEPLQALPLPAKEQEDTVNAPSESTPSEENSVTKNEQELPIQSHAALLDRQVSVTPPLPPKNMHVTPPPTPLRGITTVTPLPVPDVPAPPRPDSVYTEEEATKAATTLESNQRLIGSSSQSLKVPKRKYSEKGLEEDDPIGKFLSFLWWFFFILARVFTIAVAYEFYPTTVLTIISLHYCIMLAYLFYYSKYYDVITFVVNLWLGLVYIFSLIEYRIKFKYADWWTYRAECGVDAHVVLECRLERILVHLHILRDPRQHDALRSLVRDVSYDVQTKEMQSVQQLTIVGRDTVLQISLLRIVLPLLLS